MPKSASLKAIASCPSETPSTSTRSSATRRAFDTMENLFFREGDELSKPVPIENDDEEITELVPRPKSKRRLVLGLAMASVALGLLAVLILH